MVMSGPPHGNNVQNLWQHYPDWMQGLSARFRLICFDHRGWGLSSRGLPGNFTIAGLDADLAELIDHLELDRMAFFSIAMPGHMAVRYAVKHPERVEALISDVAHARLDAWPSGLFELSQQNWDVSEHPRASGPDHGRAPEVGR